MIILPDWRGQTAVCIGSGPSLTSEDVDVCRGRARVIAINNSYQLAPWADALYACDRQWWKWYPEALKFEGSKFSVTAQAHKCPGVTILKPTGIEGLDLTPGRIRTGRNSGYQAINLAVQCGATRILLLGYDMKRGKRGCHWHKEHPSRRNSPYGSFVRAFDSMVGPLKQAGVTVINCSRETALTCFPRMSIQDALSVAVAA